LPPAAAVLRQIFQLISFAIFTPIIFIFTPIFSRFIIDIALSSLSLRHADVTPFHHFRHCHFPLIFDAIFIDIFADFHFFMLIIDYFIISPLAYY
jgi:hypothetical protein